MQNWNQNPCIEHIQLSGMLLERAINVAFRHIQKTVIHINNNNKINKCKFLNENKFYMNAQGFFKSSIFFKVKM